MRTCDGPPWFKLCFGLYAGADAKGLFDQRANGAEFDLAIGIHEAEIADFHESGRQHVLKETPDELHDIESHGSPPLAMRFLVTKGDGSILHFDNAAVGHCHHENIRSQIF